MSAHSASPAVSVVGGGCVAPAGFFSAGSRPPGSRQPTHLHSAAQLETSCPADPGGPAVLPTGTTVTICVDTCSHFMPSEQRNAF